MLNLSSVSRIPKTVFDHQSIINKQIHIEIVLSNMCVCACPSACLCVHRNKYEVFKYGSRVSLKPHPPYICAAHAVLEDSRVP